MKIRKIALQPSDGGGPFLFVSGKWLILPQLLTYDFVLKSGNAE